MRPDQLNFLVWNSYHFSKVSILKVLNNLLKPSEILVGFSYIDAHTFSRDIWFLRKENLVFSQIKHTGNDPPRVFDHMFTW